MKRKRSGRKEESVETKVKIPVKRLDLLETLSRVKAGLPSKKEMLDGGIPSFMMNKGSVFAYKEDIIVSSSLPSPMRKLTCSVPSRELMDLLARMEDDEIFIRQKEEGVDESQLLVIGKKSRAGINISLGVPSLSGISVPEKWKQIPSREDFILGVLLCVGSAGSSGGNPILSGIHINGNMVESCDNQRATRFTFGDVNGGFKEAIVPASCATFIPDLGPLWYNQDDSWIHFKNEENTIMSIRLIEGKYPNADKIHEGSGEGDEVSLPENMSNVLGRADVFLDKRDARTSLVKVIISGKEMTVRGDGSVGWFEEKVKVAHSGNDLRFLVNPAMMLEMIKRTKKVEVDGSRSMKFIGDKFTHVVILGRSEE